MKWQKLAHLKVPFEGERVSHHQVPIVMDQTGNTVGVVYACRDASGRSRPYRVDIELEPTPRIVKTYPKPLLEWGEPGLFDSSGVMPTWSVRHDGKFYFYYIGWNKKMDVSYHNALGLAISEDGVHFKKYSRGPVLDRSIYDPCFIGTACVLKEHDFFRAWYLSCTEWRKEGDQLEPRYNIKYATSKDGIHWDRDGIVAVDYKSDEEGGLSQASVIRIGSRYHMWFSYRNAADFRKTTQNSYRIGYAESADGIRWTRNDEKSGITVGGAGEWDSEMICYPYVFHRGSKYYMLYNGNNFGRDGFGVAVLADAL